MNCNNQFKKVTLEVTGFCNAKCKWCKTGRINRYKENVSYGEFLTPEICKRGIDYLLENEIINPDEVIVDLFNWGEPFLNPRLNEILEVLNDRNIRYGLSTNASHYVKIKEEYLDNLQYLIISISGFSEKTYKNIHSLDLNNILDNIKQFSSDLKTKCYNYKIIMNYHVYQYNICEIEEAHAFCEDNEIAFSPHVAYLADSELFDAYLSKSLEYDILDEAAKELLFGAIQEKIEEYKTLEKFICPQYDNLVLDEKMNIIPCCLYTSKENMGTVYNYSGQELLELKMNFPKCKTCIQSGQAYVVNSSMPFNYGFKNADNGNYSAKIYLDYGNGFSEAETIYGGDLSKTAYKYNRTFRLPKGIKQLRFDPIENRKCAILSFKATLDGMEINPVYTNGNKTGDIYLFDTLDPQFLFQLDEKEKNIVLMVEFSCFMVVP